jgi:hypothetical protein
MKKLLAAAVALAAAAPLTLAASAFAAGAPRLYSCAHASLYRPADFQLACGDGNGYFDNVSWTDWTATSATATAQQWYNTCDPDCAAGNYIKQMVPVRLFAPKTRGARLYYSRIRVGGPHGYYATTPTPASVPSRPSRPTATPGNARAVLHWLYPGSTGGSRILTYQVQRGVSVPSRHNVAASRRSFTFTGLANGHRYPLYVRAGNAVGFSKWSVAYATPKAAAAPAPTRTARR